MGVGSKAVSTLNSLLLETVPVRQHLMRYFMEVEVTQSELEDLTHSSAIDENVVQVRPWRSRARLRARSPPRLASSRQRPDGLVQHAQLARRHASARTAGEAASRRAR